MRLLLERRGDEISLLPALKRGGEGSIHPIIGEPGLVAKVFTEPGQERAEKLQAMIANPPVVTSNAPVLLAWPVDRILNGSGGCIGYVMPYAKDKEPLFTIFHPGTRPKWADYPILLRTAKNIALTVSAFHRHGYVLGDINEFNVLVGPDASVAVVDTDSIQVRTQRNVFRCQVGKPECTPPEIIQSGMSFGQIDRYTHHDAFGLGVLIFLLLMDGNHPFAAQYVGTGGRQSLTERIAEGQWPYSQMRAGAYLPRRDAPPLESLSPRLQQLMRDCFEAGHKNPVCRPTADDWCKALTEAEDEWNSFSARFRHFYYRTLNRRALGQELLRPFNRLRPALSRVPRKAWVAIGCGIGLILLWLACCGGPESSEPRPTGGSGRVIRGEETPRLWRQVQGRDEK
jgi:DNA-binding helix-hairpin-helix protein with protein kinase domain